MQSLFEKTNREEIIHRIHQLNEQSTAQWGKMTIWQMLKHCVIAEESYLGKKQYKRKFLGYLFGKIALKNLLKDDTPLARNAKTSSDFIVTGTGDVEQEKKNWIALINEYENLSNHSITHWFFGKMNQEQVGQFAYKHADHHLRQFNV